MENKQQQQQSSTSNNNNNNNKNKLRNKILKILPKAAAAVSVTFQNPPFSPGRSHRAESNNNATSAATTTSRLKPHGNRGFSGPMIPDEARRRKPKDEAQEEPTSPKVSCIGQIKHIKKEKNAKSTSLPITAARKTEEEEEEEEEEEKKKKKEKKNKLQRMLFYTGKPKTGARKNSAATSTPDSAISEKNAPPIGYMRRFASSREAFANFDWKAQVTPEEIGRRDCYSEDDGAEESDVDAEDEADEEDDDAEIMIPFSAPIIGGGAACGGKGAACNFQPRKEINLWKRRTMAPPRPLQLKPVLTAK